MEYDPKGNNLEMVPRTSEKVRNISRRKAQAGANAWRTRSIIDTGYNASHVEVIDTEGDEGQIAEVIYANGRYAKWRERGSSRAGPRAPEWVLRDSIPTIREA